MIHLKKKTEQPVDKIQRFVEFSEYVSRKLDIVKYRFSEVGYSENLVIE